MAQPLRSLALALLLAGWAIAAPVQLELLQEPLSGPEQEQIQRSLDWIVAAYERQGLQPRLRIRARILPGFQEFRSYQRQNRSVRDGAPLSGTGYYSSSRRELVLWRSRRFPQIFVHEAQHALLRSTFRDPPKWLNEGLSECFEGLIWEPGAAEPVLRPQGPRLRKVRENWDETFAAQVLTVLTMSSPEFNRLANDRALDSYTRAWALVYFFWTRDQGEALVGDILRRIRGGTGSEEAVALAYPGGLERLREDLQAFYRDLDAPVSP